MTRRSIISTAKTVDPDTAQRIVNGTLDNQASQPDYKSFVVKKFIEPALAMK